MIKKNFNDIALAGLWRLFIWTLILLYSIIISSTVLGILSLFRLGFVVLFGLVLAALLYVFWGKHAVKLFPIDPDHDQNPARERNYSLLNWTGFGLAALLLVLLLVPILNWPMSFMEKRMIWDAGLYHFPKAVELWSTGSAWDFSISYGDYPFGYEALLGFSLFFSKDISYFSLAHLVILLLFILGTSFLTLKYSKLPPGFVLLGVIFLILSGFLPIANPWYFIHFLPYTVGKNDLFLAAVTISAIVFVPFRAKQQKGTDWIGLGITSGLAISIKPNSAPLLLLLWIYAIFFTKTKELAKGNLFLGMTLALSGAGWIIRNLIGLNKLFLPETYRIANQSIWSNLTNPDFYLQVPGGLIFSLILAVGFLILGLIKKTNIGVAEAILYLFTLLIFLITPGSVPPNDPTALAWRFGLVMLMLQFVYLVAVLDSPIRYLIVRVMESNPLTYLVSGIMMILMAGFFFSQRQILQKVPKYAAMLERPYSVTGFDYLSVFDYIDQNIHHSVVWVEGAQPYYGYDPDFTNTITRSKQADYIVILDGSPEDYWFDVSDWEIIYQDSRGLILEKQPTLSD